MSAPLAQRASAAALGRALASKGTSWRVIPRIETGLMDAQGSTRVRAFGADPPGSRARRAAIATPNIWLFLVFLLESLRGATARRSRATRERPRRGPRLAVDTPGFPRSTGTRGTPLTDPADRPSLPSPVQTTVHREQ
jgi:hypothetical protein